MSADEPEAEWPKSRTDPHRCPARAGQEGRSRRGSRSSSAPIRASARPTRCCRRRRSAGAKASTSWSASSRPTGAPRPRRCCAASRCCRGASSPIAARVFGELDLDALLWRKPKLALVDELAHTNVPGQPPRQALAGRRGAAGRRHRRLHHAQRAASREPERRGRADLGRAGARDAARHGPGAGRRDRAGRPAAGRPDRSACARARSTSATRSGARSATSSRKGNLTALRELAMRAAAERVDAQMVDYMRAHAIAGPWPTQDRLLVCVNEFAGREEAGAHRQAHGRPGAHALDRAQRAHAAARQPAGRGAGRGSPRRSGWPRASAARPRPLHAESDVAGEILALRRGRATSAASCSAARGGAAGPAWLRERVTEASARDRRPVRDHDRDARGGAGARPRHRGGGRAAQARPAGVRLGDARGGARDRGVPSALIASCRSPTCPWSS